MQQPVSTKFLPYVRVHTGKDRPFAKNYHFRQYVSSSGLIKKIVHWNLNLRISLLFPITDFHWLSQYKDFPSKVLKENIRNRLVAWRKLRHYYPVDWSRL